MEKIIGRKKEVKLHGKEQTEKMSGDLLAMENQLFSTKVELETLKIDKKYYEEQVNELQKKNTELKGNLDNMKSVTTSLKQHQSSTSKRTDMPIVSNNIAPTAKQSQIHSDLGFN